MKAQILLVLLLPALSFAQLSPADYLRQKETVSCDSIARHTATLRQLNGRYGLQNVLGEWLIEPEYDWIETAGGRILDFPAFHGEHVFVKQDGLMGVIDLHGNTIIPCRYHYISEEGEEYHVTDKQERTAAFARDGRQLTKFQTGEEREAAYKREPYDYFDYLYHNKEVTDHSGKTLLKLKETPYYVEIGRESEGFTVVYFYVANGGADAGKSHGIYGYINSRGEWAIPPSFSAKNVHESANGPTFNPYFYSGRALIWENKRDFRYIDTLGNTVLLPDTTLGHPFAYPFNKMGYCIIEYYKPKGGQPETVYYNTDGSERLHLSPTQHPMTTPNGAVSPQVFWGHLSVYDSKTKEYLFYDSTLTKIVYRFSIADSLSTMKGKKLSPHFCSYAIALTKHRKDKMATKIIAWDGTVLSDWSPSNRTYDVLTDIYVVRKNGGVQLVQGATDSVVYSCDSCISSHGYDLQHWGSGYETTYGVFRMYDRHAATKGNLEEVNYKGEVIYREVNVTKRGSYVQKDFRPEFDRVDLAINSLPDSYELRMKPSLPYTPFQLTQADFDSLYVRLGWEKIRKVRKEPEPVYKAPKGSRRNGTIQFLPPVVRDEELEEAEGEGEE